MPRRGGDSCRPRSAARRFPDGPELTGISGVAAILHRFVVFHQQFTTFVGKERSGAETRMSARVSIDDA
jgi:hypothetical protein